MVSEHINGFIMQLIEKTEKGQIKWQRIERMPDWYIEKRMLTHMINEEYFIDDEESFFIEKEDGYLVFLCVKYGNAVVFSPALDKYLLIAKIHEGMPLENLTKYSSDEYIVQLKQLHEEIQRECYGKYEMPDELYKFLDKILEEDSNG
ncbi:hypothetical protein MR818_05650 [bacterium]|nr:hypothetical protein [bacterium]